VPRIGDEVIVDFINGDPDYPIITGRVYNAAKMPPWTLPENATQMGIYSRSSPDGNYETANAIRFEDKKGQEQLWIHAERNQDVEVENDETHWVGRDRKKTIVGNEAVQVHKNRLEKVDLDELVRIGQNRVIEVGKVLSVKAGEMIELRCGQSSIEMFSNGFIRINGTRFAFEAAGHVQISSGDDQDIDLN